MTPKWSVWIRYFLITLPFLAGCWKTSSDVDLPQGVEIGNPSSPSGVKNILILPEDGTPSYRVVLQQDGQSWVSQFDRLTGLQPAVALDGGIEAQPLYGESILASLKTDYRLENGTLALGGVLSNGKTMALSLEWTEDGDILEGAFTIDGKSVPASFFEEGLREASHATLTPEGKLLIVGLSQYQNFSLGSPWPDDGIVLTKLLLMRLHADGRLDESFGEGGVVLEGFGTDNANGDYVILLPDGKILVGGHRDGRVFVARYTQDGTLDSGFGDAGKTTLEPNADWEGLSDLQVDGEGRILVARLSIRYDRDSAHYEGDLYRLLPDGALDASFAVGGRLADDAAAVLPLDEGKILVARILPDPSHPNPCYMGTGQMISLKRYLPDGTLDSAFRPDSAQGLQHPCRLPHSLHLKRSGDGGVMVGGTYYDAYHFEMGVYLAKFLEDGSPDPSFGDGGLTVFKGFSKNAVLGPDFGMELTPEDSVLFTTPYHYEPYDDAEDAGIDFNVFRLTSDGKIDKTFGRKGIAATDIGTTAFQESRRTFDWPVAMTKDADGSIFVVGNSETDIAVVRFFIE